MAVLTSAPTNYFESVCNELGLKVFSHLEPADRLSAARVSKLFREWAYDDKSLKNISKGYNLEGIQGILKGARYLGIDLTTVTFENIKEIEKEVKDTVIKIWKRIQEKNPELTDYPADFTKLEDEKCTKIIEEFDSWITNNKDKIIKLDLSNLELKYLPKSIGNFTSLKELNLKNNQISVIPNWLFENLKSLERLCFGNNKLEIIPPTIDNLSSLQKLNLCQNKLKNIPSSIGNLKLLRGLDLSRNELKNIPSSIGNLKELQFVNISNNPLESIPSSLLKLDKKITFFYPEIPKRSSCSIV